MVVGLVETLDHRVLQIFGSAQDCRAKGRLHLHSGCISTPAASNAPVIMRSSAMPKLSMDWPLTSHLWVLWITCVVCRDFLSIQPWRFALAVERRRIVVAEHRLSSATHVAHFEGRAGIHAGPAKATMFAAMTCGWSISAMLAR